MAERLDYLVTGGAGFIGSNIVREAVGAGARVRVLDNLSTGRRVNLADLEGRIDFREGDIRDAGDVAAAVAGVDNVLHLAALPSVIQSVEEPVETDAVNAGGTLGMLEACRKAGVKRFVFSSSCAVYGDGPELPKRESLIPLPLSPYAVQKLVGEHYCKVFHELYGLQTFVLRYFNVFGPRQNPGSDYAAVIPIFLQAVLRGRAPLIYGDGGQTRDFVFVRDVVRANLACCGADAAAAGKVYNVASGCSRSIAELAASIVSVLDGKLSPVHDAERPGEVRHSAADISQAAAGLGWRPCTEFDEGLRRTAEFLSADAG